MGATAGTKTPLAGQARDRQAAAEAGSRIPITQTPPGGVDDYYTPDNLRRDYESANPGKNFEGFLSSAEDQYGREAMAPVRSGLTSKPAPQPARRPSRFGIKNFR